MASRHPRYAFSVASMRVPGDRSGAAQARHFVRDTLGEWGIDGDVLDDCQLLVSELVTNSILHARSEALVSLERSPESLRVSVCDASSAPPEPRVCGPDDVAGRGLLLVERLARRWGVVADGGGKCVWFEVDPRAIRPRTSRRGR
jgi:anti-sigma regulatory factor (Ser/Thr protein kinase)